MSPDTPSDTSVHQYFDAVRALVDKLLHTQGEQIEMAANWTAAAIMSGNLLYVTGSGHSHVIAEELFARAGGLVAINPILEPSLLLHSGASKSTRLERLHDFGCIIIDDSELGADDVLIVASNSGRNSVPVEMAVRAREIGAKVIALTSMDHATKVDSRHRSGSKLHEVAHLVIDNCVAYGDASISIDGLRGPMGPLSTVAGVTVVNATVARAAEIMIAKGYTPQVFVSANLAAEQRLDARELRSAHPRIRHY